MLLCRRRGYGIGLEKVLHQALEIKDALYSKIKSLSKRFDWFFGRENWLLWFKSCSFQAMVWKSQWAIGNLLLLESIRKESCHLDEMYHLSLKSLKVSTPQVRSILLPPLSIQLSLKGSWVNGGWKAPRRLNPHEIVSRQKTLGDLLRIHSKLNSEIKIWWPYGISLTPQLINS